MLRRILLSLTASLAIFTNVTTAQGSSLPAFTALSAEADPHTGSANFGVPIEIPPGRAGVQPNIQLHYNSSAPNGILGVGWNLELGSIQRSGKGGVPHYDDTDTLVLIQNGGAQELVLDAGTGLYRGKVEGAFMKIARVGGHWEVTDKSGVKYFFGETQGSQEYDPADGGRIFKWCLNRVADAHGNEMTVTYFRDENMLYPQEIAYTGNPARGLAAFARVVFERELRPENTIDRYNAGFRMSARYRISRITASVNGNLQRKYDLVYDDSRTTGRSLLTSIAQYGSDGSSSLPPVTFSYQTPKNPDFNYAVTPLSSSVAGDNLWNYRYAGSYDRGPNNYGSVPPGGFDVSWGPVYTQSSGGNWNINSKGNLTFSAGQDSAHWFWTYLYIDGSSPKTLTIPYTTEGVDGVWINPLSSTPSYTTSAHQSWTLQPGYNLVEMTFYNQNQGFGFNLNYDLADGVNLMSSSTVVLPQLSGDFNADGRSDIATFTSSSGKVEVERSSGTSFSPKATWASGFAANGKLVLGDFNGDGRMDIGGFDPASGNWRVGLSDGGRFNDAGVWFPGFGVNEEPSSGDFNGDGLADILTFYKASGNLYVRIALNKVGSFAALSGGQNILIGSEADVPIVGDFNGDGQIDFGAFNKAGGNWTIRLNTGDILAGLRQLPAVTGFGANRNTVVSDFNYDGLTDIGYYDDATGKVVYRVSKGLSFAPAVELPFVFNIKGPNTQIQSGDYNGDTLIDFAVYNLIGKLEIAFSNGVMPDILSSVENGLGGESSITYNAAVNYPQTFLPFPIQVVKSITQSNGLGESYTINNSYEQGLWDAQKREFRGFGLVRTTDPDGNYSETVFAQDGIYKGRVTEQRTYDSSGKLYGKTLHTWAYEEVAAGSNFIYLKRKDNFVYDGDATGRRTAEEFFFGEMPQMGNLTKAVQLGEVDLSTGSDTGNDTRAVETAYVQNTSGNNWIAGLPRQTTVKDNAGNIVRQAWFYYDNQGNTTAPVKGLLTKKEDWAGTGQVNPVTQYAYDTVGNLLTTTDPKGNVTRVAYDTTYNMFPLTTENALGHKVTNEYYGVNGVALSEGGGGFSGLWGQVKSTTDPNQQQGKRSYDVFGRAVAAVSPLDSAAFPTQTTSIEFLGSYTKVTTRQRVEHGKAATVDAVSFIDGFGRLAQTKARTEVTGRYVVNGQTRYDSRGLKSRQFLPAFSTNPMDVIDVIDTAKPHTLITYDAMGRPVRTTNPDGTYASVSYDDWAAAATDENGHRQRSYFDAYGRLIKKEEYLGADGRSPDYPAKPYTLYAATLYTYDSEGNLLQTKDAYNNITAITYDALGRKVAMDDPDMGRWSYQYDLNGNLTKQIDAKGQTLTFTYDALNRLTNKTDGIGGTVNVNYTYDNTSSTNSKGRLTQAAYAGGNTQFAYDELGRELQSVKAMNTKTYSVNRQYDALNNLAQIQYPDQKGVSYKYNATGQIEAVTNDPTLVPPVTLNAPELYLIQTGSMELKVSWGSVIDAVGYKIKYGTLSGNYTTTLDVGGASSKVITGLANDTTYYFVVLAYNADTQSSASNERSATPAAPTVITMPSPWVQYAFNDDAASSNVVDTAGALYPAFTEQTSLYTPDLTGSGTASASSNLGGYDPSRAFDNDFTNEDGWVSNNTQSGWLAYEFSSAQKINRYVIAPRKHIYMPYDGNPHAWTFEGLNGSGWDILDTRSYSSWSWQNPVTFNFANDKAYSKYRLNISANGGHGEVGITEMEMMAYAPLYTSTVASPGRINNAFNLNGTGQLVNADSLLAAKNHVVGTIALWVRPDSPSSGDVIFSMGDTDGSNRVELRAANDLEFYIANSVLNLRVSLPNALVAGLWSHIALVQDGNGIKGYINGSEAAVTVLDQSLGLDAWFNSTWGIDNARVGCAKNNNQGNHNYYDGQLDDLRYYTHALKAAEVKALYNTGSGTEAKNPQYTEYTPLSKASYDSTSYMVLRTSGTENAGTSYLVHRTSGSHEVRSTNDDVRTVFSTVASWLERNILGVGDAEAHSLTESYKQESSSNGLVAIEAENYNGNVPPAAGTPKWDLVTTTGQSGSGSMKANPNSGVNNDTGYTTKSPRLDYKIKFVKTGTHYVWIRGIGATGSDDSLHAGLDGQALTTSDRITGFTTSWKWSKTTADAGALATINVAAVGEHTLNIWMREDGMVIDKIVVTSSSAYIPSGTGPAQSPQFPPAAPVLNTATPGNAQVSLSWSAVSGASGYKVYRRVVSTAYATATDVGPVTSRTVTGLTNGTLYYFVVAAYNAAGQSVYSNEVSAAPVASTSVPAAPVLNTATAGDKQVTLSWTVVSGAAGYKVKYGTTGGTYTTTLDAGNVTSYPAGGLTNGKTYYFVVTAYNSAGTGANSNEKSAVPTIQPFATTLEAETMPTKTTGGTTTGGWNIWSSGYIEDTITFPRSGTYEFEVVARGSVAAGVWPNMQLRLDQVGKADITVNTTAWKSFIKQVSVASGSHRVAVAFTNDYKTTTEDRNLYVDKVIIREIVSSPPSAPTLNSPAASDTKVDLSWSAVTGVTGYKIYYGTVAGQYGTPMDAGNATTSTVTGLTNGTVYYFVVTAYNAGSESARSNERSAAPVAPPQGVPLPQPWSHQDIGTVNIAGGSGYADGVFTVTASGSDIWNNADSFHYTYQILDGDGEIIARVTGITDTNTWAKAGVMMRETLSPSSRHAFMLISKGQGSSFQRRLTTGASSVSNHGDTVRVPYWVKLTRRGNSFSGYKSVDGVTWVQVGPVETITMSAKIYVGLAVTSHNNSALNTSTLSNVSVGDKLAAPVLNTAVAGDKQVALSWNAVTGATGYKIYYGTVAGQYGTPMDAGNTTARTVTGLTNGTTYYFAATAYNANGESVYSNETSAAPVAPPPVGLAAPVLNAPVAGDAQVSLSWGAVNGAAGYKVRYGTTSGGGSGATDFTHDPDCVAGWKLDESSGLVTDACGGNNGTASGTLTRGVAGKYNQGIEFFGYAGGNNAYVNFGSDVSLDNLRPRTLVAWINPHNLGEGNAGTIFDKDYQDGWVLRLAANNNIAFSQAFSGGVVTWTTTTNAVRMNTWQHVAVTYTASGIGAVPVIYINGVAQALSGATPFGTIDNDAAFNLLFGIKGGVQEFDGVIDEAAIFKRVLTPVEITSIRNTRLDGGLGMTYATQLDVGNVTNYTVTGLANGTTYYFVVSAKDTAGESPNSNERSATPVAPPPTVTLTAIPATITAGESTALTWSSTNAGSCTASGGSSTELTTGWSGSKAVSGTANVTPSLTTVYTLTCTGTGGSASASAEVTVNPPVVQETPTLYVKNVDYNAAGQMTKVEYGNGDVTTYAYNPLNLRLTRLYTVDKNGAALQDLNYTYDSAGNILSIDDKVNTADQTFKYDELNRLTEAAGQGYGTKTYAYDTIGNIVQKDGKTYFYGDGVAAGPHAVTSLSDGTTFTYDANGNLTQQTQSTQSTQYTYDAENRLVKVTKNGSTVGQYEYDGDGGRTKKTATVGSTTATTTFVGSLFETSGARSTKFIFLGGQRVAAVTNSPTVGSTTLYYHADHLGGANVLTDATGFKKELIEYEPFGQESRHEKYGSSEEVAWYYFTGKPKDDETGLYYFGVRYYDPKLGRFIQPDTIIPYPSDPQSFNRYTYANNNPVNVIDPTGHKWSWKKFWNGFAGAVVGVAAAVLLGPAGFALVGSTMAGIIGGAVGGAITGGLNGGWQGALMGAAMGGALGGVAGWGIGNYGWQFGAGMLVAGAGVAATTDSWDSFAGGVAGGITGGILGNGIASAFRDPLSSASPAGGVRSNKIEGRGVGTTPEKALKVANDTGSLVFYTKSRGVPADIVRGGVRLLFKNTLASRNLAQYMIEHPNSSYNLHSEMTITALGAAKMLQGSAVGGDFTLISPFYTKGTAENVFGGIGATVNYVSPHLADSAGIFAAPNPVTAPIYGALGIVTLEHFHGYEAYQQQINK